MSRLNPRWQAISASCDSLPEMFPFLLVFDKAGEIISAGPSLQKLCGELKPGARFDDHFELVTPAFGFDYQKIREQLFTTFFLHTRDGSHMLRGQMLPQAWDTDEVMLYLCTPVVREMSDVTRLGLSLKDFAIHDSVIDLLLVLQAKSNTIRDIKRIHELLKREVESRRKAERELQELNEHLELRVARRTAELKQANRQLKQSLSQLEEHNRELAVINKMGEMLQGCGSLEESLDVISYSLGRLLPRAGGFLQVRTDEAGGDLTITWGATPHTPVPSIPADCEALRSGEAHLHRGGAESPRCRHLMGVAECDSLCVPLMANNSCHGLLSLQCLEQEGERRSDVSFQSRLQFILTASEHIALALANLRLQESLRHQAVMDSLTGLYNRRYMSATLEREILRADRDNTGVGLAIIDVDHFKRVNDNHGHETGDRVLKTLGEYLKRRIRGDDVACRFGGEEFVLILPGAGPLDLQRRAEKLRREIERGDYATGNADLPPLTVSVGLARYPDQAHSLDDLLQVADLALYRAKAAGRNRVCAA